MKNRKGEKLEQRTTMVMTEVKHEEFGENSGKPKK